ncbi:hypothetical protein Rwratislav_11518, partial [Rhodococcus wratislaviensis IFP 2016]
MVSVNFLRISPRGNDSNMSPTPGSSGQCACPPVQDHVVEEHLIDNASKAAVRAHATSPAALAHYLNKGVRVLSSPTLHAKVIATNTRAVIGSANASENSTLADDAVVITDDPQIIASVRKFIDGLDEITEVDQVFLDDAILEWEIGRAVPLPGVTGRVRIETDFLPTPVTRMFVKHAVDYEPT